MADKKRQPKDPGEEPKASNGKASNGKASQGKGSQPKKPAPRSSAGRASMSKAKPAPRSSSSGTGSRAPRSPAAPRGVTQPEPVRPDTSEPIPAQTAVDIAEPVEQQDGTKEIPGWRQRLYRIPLLGAIAYVIWPPRTSHSLMRRGVSSTLAVVAILGIGMAAYPWAGEKYPFFYKIPVEKLIEWSNFLSDLQTNRLQDKLADEFDGLDRLSLKEGGPLTRFEIPKFGVDTIVVQGTSASALRAGAGHYPTTALPGQKGNVGIAGHRTTYGRPFNRIDDLVVGDKIILTTPVARYTYTVSKAPWITTPFDWSIVAKTKDPVLTLTTCHPIGSARERLVVRAKLVKTEALRSA